MSNISKQEPEEQAPRKLHSELAQRPFARPAEVLIITAVIALVAFISVSIGNKISEDRDVAAARIVSNEVINDIQRRDGAAVRKLGTPTFQSSYSAAGLTRGFVTIEIATLKPPTLIQQTPVKASSGETIFFTYEYTALKVPYYVQTALVKNNGRWEITNIAGNADESALD